MQEFIKNIRGKLFDTSPIIHCITNPISINQCANLILALGCRPIMAEHPHEAAEITKAAGALLLNIGNITDARMESIFISAKCAAEHGIPFVFDAVGAAGSHLRKEYSMDFLHQFTPSVLKGNYSEIKAIYDSSYFCGGVDAESSLCADEMCRIASKLAKRLRCPVLASGAVDIISDGKRLFLIRNGTAQLGKITGTGCMQGAAAAAFLAAEQSLASIAAACAVFGICGELAAAENKNGTFGIRLTDALSSFSDADISRLIQTEEIRIETA